MCMYFTLRATAILCATMPLALHLEDEEAPYSLMSVQRNFRSHGILTSDMLIEGRHQGSCTWHG